MNEKLINNPIGIFDSGIGGLTVLKEISKLMPHEDLVYFGDTARLPYGSKSESTIIKYSLENTFFLNSKHAKIIVIACNTASAVSLHYLKNIIKLPVLGVIECGALAAVRTTRKKKIGVIGTKATIKSGAYSKAIKALDSEIEVYEVPTPLLVHLVEENWIERDITKAILMEYLSPLLRLDIDTLVLGCTHYPLLDNQIKELIGNIKLVDSAIETAHSVLSTLKTDNLLTNKRSSAGIDIYLSDMYPDFNRWANDFIGKEFSLNIVNDRRF
jgi:glutamate racemase